MLASYHRHPINLPPSLVQDGLNYLGNPSLVHAQSIIATLAVQASVLCHKQLCCTCRSTC